MDIHTVDTLLTLARLSISQEEKALLGEDLQKILAYVEQIETLPNELFQEVHSAVNLLREDEVTNQPGEYTEALLAEMPKSKDGYLEVKQIL
jgi:aspartyl/glutamyl-tRNA(Asn/Gln) amidotransferase C subunit